MSLLIMRKLSFVLHFMATSVAGRLAEVRGLKIPVTGLYRVYRRTVDRSVRCSLEKMRRNDLRLREAADRYGWSYLLR